jgi:hypothetical protein
VLEIEVNLGSQNIAPRHLSCGDTSANLNETAATVTCTAEIGEIYSMFGGGVWCGMIRKCAELETTLMGFGQQDNQLNKLVVLGRLQVC